MSSIKIMLDPGHGAGASFNRGFVGGNEGDANYNFCVGHLKPALEAKGFTVAMTRKSIKDNPSLAQRSSMGAGYDLFWSWHSNALNKKVSGSEVYDSTESNHNKALAEIIVSTIAKTIGIPNRGVRYRTSEGDWKVYSNPPNKANYYGVLRGNQAKSAMLSEAFYHDNKEDVAKYWKTYKQLASNLAEAVAKFYKVDERKDYTTQQFIDLLAPLAMEDYKKSGILPSVTIAQGMVESANGNSELARNANNYFGIKASPPWKGEVYEKKTQEWVNGKYITVTAKFRKYKSLEESVKDHGAFFRSAPFREILYKPVYTAKDWATAVNALTGTYATSPTYAKTLTSRIVDYQLARFDKVEEKPVIEQKFEPVHIAVFAENSADMGSAMRIVSQVQNAVWVDASRLNPDLYKEVVQVGGSKHEKASVHLQGANRYETDRKVTEWINSQI